ncbi:MULTISPECIES: histidine kinase [Pseudoalteromonas]|nr:histidine kinase [Pseudoalteromonas sp.]
MPSKIEWLNVLQQQINPHFLFNTLNNLTSML